MREPVRLFHAMRRPAGASRPGARERTLPRWQPAADVVETGESYFLALDVPGVPREAFDLRITRQTLRVRGVRPPVGTDERAHHLERPVGPFERSFTFPRPIDPDRVVAHYEHGVLRVMVPKAAEARARRIRVS